MIIDIPTHPADKRSTEILAAAQKRFAHYGLSKTTMDEIARDVGMGKASLYYYYETKEDLFRAVITQEQEGFKTIMRRMLQQDLTASQKLKEYVHERFAYFLRVANLGILSYQAFTEVKPIFQDLSHEFSKREMEFILQIIHEGKKKKEFQINDVQSKSELFLHCLQSLRQRVLREIVEFSSENKEEKYLKLEKEMMLFTKIFIGGISA